MAKAAPTPERKPVLTDPAEALIVVGIGASAGGLEALRSLVGSLPRNARMAYIIAQHLSPQHDSLLTELLARETELPVEEVRDNLAIAPNRIYVTPQNTNIEYVAGRLELSPPSGGAHPKPSVDVLLTSIAEHAGDRAVAVILSGTGSDGALGVRAVKAAGGYTYAQDDNTAKYNGMPHAAVATGCVDFIMPPERIAEEVGNLAEIERGADAGAPPVDVSVYEEILKVLRLRTGTDFTRYKENTVRRRLQRRMAANHMTQAEHYLEFVKDHPDEADRAAQDILISVTSFFRDAEAFEKLERYVKKLLEKKQAGDQIRVWVAGCATGEEAFSIALLLYEQLGTTVVNYKIQVFATDIDLPALGKARKAVFHASAMSQLRPELVSKYFTESGEYYVLNKAVRDLVVIARQDITEDPPFLRLDLISCRNLLIYFKSALQNKILEIFHYALSEGGYLFLGKSESAKQGQELYQTIDAEARIYRRLSVVPRTRPVFKGQPSAPVEIKSRTAAKKTSPAEHLHNALMAAYAPPAVLVDSRLNILQVHGDVHPYLRIPAGDLDWQLHKLLRRELRLDARALITRAKREKTTVHTPWVRLIDTDASVRVAVHPMPAQALEEDLYTVSFERKDTELIEHGDAGDAGVRDVDAHISELEHELTATREHLQTAIEELETSNEELQSVNEELQSANEELQSTNEELETANEELQSTNEELTTVNDELQLKSTELTAAHNDLENVKDSLSSALIVVDTELRVRLHNPIAARLFKFGGRDSHPVITSVSSKLDLPRLRENILKVIKTGTPYAQQIEGKHIYLFSIVPYRRADKKGIGGAILTFVDNSAVLRDQRDLRHSQAALNAIISHSPLLTYYRDTAGRFVYVSNEFERRFGLAARSAVGKHARDILPPEIARLFTRRDHEAISAESPLQSEDVLT